MNEVIDSSKSAMQTKATKQLTSENNKLENKLNKLKKEIVKSKNLKKNEKYLKNEFKFNFVQLIIYSSSFDLISFIKIFILFIIFFRF